MRLLRQSLMLFLCLAGTVAQADIEQARITGFAYARGSDTLLYTETHRVTVEDGKIINHKTEYKAPDGGLICTKTLDYRQHRFAPAFELRDLRDGYVEGAEYTNDGYRMHHRASRKAELQSTTVPVSDMLVADAGFNLYVRARMDALLAGETEKFDMALAAEQTVLSFQARMLERNNLFDRPAVRIRIEPATLLRLLVDPIYLTYDTGNGELLRYEGLSNIRDASGDRYDTRIDFPPDGQQYANIQRH